ncbi:MAG TPA: hypothetical protein VHE30_01205 [Polyangiaceae bacterium]|nr:hypothetical protein [Polyangiaceae bacterium]
MTLRVLSLLSCALLVGACSSDGKSGTGGAAPGDSGAGGSSSGGNGGSSGSGAGGSSGSATGGSSAGGANGDGGASYGDGGDPCSSCLTAHCSTEVDACSAADRCLAELGCAQASCHAVSGIDAGVACLTAECSGDGGLAPELVDVVTCITAHCSSVCQ